MAEKSNYNNADVAFVRKMIPHHRMAVDMAKTVLDGGKNKEVAKIAAAVVAAQSKEIDVLTAWLEAIKDNNGAESSKGNALTNAARPQMARNALAMQYMRR